MQKEKKNNKLKEMLKIIYQNYILIIFNINNIEN